MIVDPDFLTHWKTQALVEALSDPVAPLYVIALWSHCHQRRTDRFEGISFATFAKICRYPNKEKAPAFFEAMKECGFVENEGETIIAHGWLEANATLIGRWRGGQATQSRWSAKAKPQAQPIAEPKLSQGDRRREDRIGEEKSTSTHVDVAFPTVLDSDGFKTEWKNFRAHRLKVRSAMTPRAEELILATLATRPDQALAGVRMAIEFGWKGFKWEWFDNKQNNGSTTHQRSNPGSSNRNTGTANEGRSSQYAGVGRVT